MTTIDALIERLRGLTGPDRAADVLIENAFGLAKFRRSTGALIGDADYVRDGVQPLTASVDAALAFTDRVLPGWRWGVSSHAFKTGAYPDGKAKYTDGFRAHLTPRSALRPMPLAADALTAPIAILLATLTALQQTEARS